MSLSEALRQLAIRTHFNLHEQLIIHIQTYLSSNSENRDQIDLSSDLDNLRVHTLQ